MTTPPTPNELDALAKACVDARLACVDARLAYAEAATRSRDANRDLIHRTNALNDAQKAFDAAIVEFKKTAAAESDWGRLMSTRNKGCT